MIESCIACSHDARYHSFRGYCIYADRGRRENRCACKTMVRRADETTVTFEYVLFLADDPHTDYIDVEYRDVTAEMRRALPEPAENAS